VATDVVESAGTVVEVLLLDAVHALSIMAAATNTGAAERMDRSGMFPRSVALSLKRIRAWVKFPAR